jgi:O-antigen ligase
MRTRPWLTLENLLYLLPLSLLAGTNFNLLQAGEKSLAVGTTEFLLLVLLVGLARRHLLGQANLVISRSFFPLVCAYSAALLASLVANVLLTRGMPSLDALITVARWFEHVLILLIAAMLIKKEQQVRILLGMLLAGVLLNTVVGLYQAATFEVSASRIYGLFVSASNREGDSVSNPNVIGTVFMGGALFCLSYALNRSTFRRGWFYILLVPIVIAMATSLSRSALLGLLVGLFTLSRFYPSHHRVFVGLGIGAVGLLAGVALIFRAFLNRLLNSLQLAEGRVETISALSRISGWQESLEYIFANPWFGIGYGDVARRTEGILTTTDNYYLEVLMTTGLVGFALLLGMLWHLYNYTRRMRAPEDTFRYAFRAGFIATFVAFLLANGFSGLFMNPRLLGLFWLLTGMMVQLVRLDREFALMGMPDCAPPALPPHAEPQA